MDIGYSGGKFNLYFHLLFFSKKRGGGSIRVWASIRDFTV